VLDENGNLIETEDYLFENFLNNLAAIDKFVSDVMASTEPAYKYTEFYVYREQLKFKRYNLERLPLSKYFTKVINLGRHLLLGYEFSDNVELFLNSCRILNLGPEYFNHPMADSLKKGIKNFELFNDLIGLIRANSQSVEFRSKISYLHYNSSRNYAAAVKFVQKLFVRRLMVLRIDLYYYSEYAKNVTPEDAKKDLARFLYNLRRNKELSDNLEGYIWKWEYGHQKKIHCHMLFFYNGSQVQNDEYWSHNLGTYWNEIISNGRGRFYNGNTKLNKAKYESRGLLGIGMIDRIHDDPAMDKGKAKRDILINKILKYILKADQVLLAKKLGGASFRIFGKGRGYNHD
jgi:hypothetical protein